MPCFGNNVLIKDMTAINEKINKYLKIGFLRKSVFKQNKGASNIIILIGNKMLTAK